MQATKLDNATAPGGFNSGEKSVVLRSMWAPALTQRGFLLRIAGNNTMLGMGRLRNSLLVCLLLSRAACGAVTHGTNIWFGGDDNYLN
jgi:hypothetical protein